MVNFVEGLRKIQKCSVKLEVVSQAVSKVVCCDDKLRNAATEFSKSMLCIVQNSMFF